MCLFFQQIDFVSPVLALSTDLFLPFPSSSLVVPRTTVADLLPRSLLYAWSLRLLEGELRSFYCALHLLGKMPL